MKISKPHGKVVKTVMDKWKRKCKGIFNVKYQINKKGFKTVIETLKQRIRANALKV